MNTTRTRQRTAVLSPRDSGRAVIELHVDLVGLRWAVLSGAYPRVVLTDDPSRPPREAPHLGPHSLALPVIPAFGAGVAQKDPVRDPCPNRTLKVSMPAYSKHPGQCVDLGCPGAQSTVAALLPSGPDKPPFLEQKPRQLVLTMAPAERRLWTDACSIQVVHPYRKRPVNAHIVANRESVSSHRAFRTALHRLFTADVAEVPRTDPTGR